MGWESTYAGRPTAIWTLDLPLTLSLPTTINEAFRFTAEGEAGLRIAIESSESILNPTWEAVETLVLSGGADSFTDTMSTGHPRRFYRVRDQ